MASSRYDVAVVGAGPAGLSAAAAALRAGARVVLIDAGHQPGGQFWRHPPGDLAAVAGLHHDLGTFRALVAGTARAERLLGHQVWTIERRDGSFAVHTVSGDTVSGDGEEETTARTVVLAPGAYDRQVPFPGWDLPGVYAAGGAQALLKGHQVVAGRRVVVGGTGPFLLSVATGLAARGAEVVAVMEANTPTAWVRQLPPVAPMVGRLAEGMQYAATLARHRVPFRSRRAIVAAHGTHALEAVTVARLDRDWQVVPGSQEVLACDAAAVGWGFTPQLELPLALGCATRVDVDGSLVVQVDDGQLTSVPDVYVAGEAGGVGGASLAVVEGDVAGRMAAGAGTVPARLRRRGRALRRFATAMHRVYPVRDGWQSWLRADTVVCRCEEATVQDVRDAIDELGASDARSVKLLTRAGMGWCQGRVCGFATAGLASSSGRPADPRGVSERPIAAPFALGRLAGKRSQ